MDLSMDKQITDTYEVIREIGSGGGGTVYEAYHKRLKKKVVLKKQHDSIRGLVNERTETDTLKNLRHSYLPQVLDFIVTDQAVFTVMDFIPGKSMKQILTEEKRLSENRVIKYAQQLCEALVYLHNSKPPVIHGDIKPDNVMLTPEDTICLIDFNISSALGATNSFAFGYTLGYAAPEQRSSFAREKSRLNNSSIGKISVIDDTSGDTAGEGTEIIEGEQSFNFDKRSDIYSYGATLYHMLSGIKPAFSCEEIVPIGKLVPGLNKGLEDIITKSMKPMPAERFQSFEEIKKILSNIIKYDLKYRISLVKKGIAVIAGIALVGLLGFTMLLVTRKYLENQESKKLETAMAYYQQSEYEEGIHFITDSLLDSSMPFSAEEAKANAYYLRGNCLLEEAEYADAVADFKEAIQINPDNADYYRDYAIALARDKKTDEALQLLKKAEDKDISSGDILIVRSEIETSLGNMTAARELLQQCIQTATDEKQKARAYVSCAKLYGSASEDELGTSIALLEEASRELPQEYQINVLELLAQDYIDLNDLTGNAEAAYQAVDVFNKIIARGWDTYVTHNNMVILYEKVKDYSLAEEQIQYMLEHYPNEYNTYKRHAFLEIDKQNLLELSQRNYADFLEYYSEATRLYENQNQTNDDIEMKLLSEIYTQLEKEGLL